MAADGKLTVTETITARAEGRNIKRGIFRDFPLYALDANNRRTKVDFDVVSVERDGAAEDWRTENIDGGIRIYTGSAERFLPTGEHIFQITYTTARQIRYFSDYDELTGMSPAMAGNSPWARFLPPSLCPGRQGHRHRRLHRSAWREGQGCAHPERR